MKIAGCKLIKGGRPKGVGKPEFTKSSYVFTKLYHQGYL
jgi:hypothetical protein